MKGRISSLKEITLASRLYIPKRTMLLACLYKKWQVSKVFTSDAGVPPNPHCPSAQTSQRESFQGETWPDVRLFHLQNFFRQEFQVKETSSFLCHRSGRWRLRLRNQTHKRELWVCTLNQARWKWGSGGKRNWALSWLWSSLWKPISVSPGEIQ